MSLLNMNSQFYDFIIVTLLSLIIGLEQRRHHNEQEEGTELVFGTDRTFTFIGILGFILYELDTINKTLFIGGGAVVSVLLCIFYLKRIEAKKKYGVTSIIAALITYCLAPLIITQPKWFALLIVVTVLILIELKSEFINISKKFDKGEFITLAKFLIIAFIILPNLPKEPLTSSIPISLYNMWLALVVVSGISYFSYLLHKFVFPKSGIILTGLLGGLYSSTSVTLLLSKRSNEKVSSPYEYAASILLACSVMYLRVFLLLVIFNKEIAFAAAPYLGIFCVICIVIGYVLFKKGKTISSSAKHEIIASQNPLEFTLALLFAVFYVLFSFLSHYAEKQFGETGMDLMSVVAGFADVDAFVTNLVQGKFIVNNSVIVFAVLQTTTANNIIKMIYSLLFAEKKVKQLALIGFGSIIVVNLAIILLIRL
ncbi:MAG TPA: DUF4010 domain-containing protein [Bacteroidia bacterium]|nr:DUF4010 domain-containing protein [Bacteroidia bacterium]